MTERSVRHATFTIERSYAVAPSRVFAAFADPAARRRWLVEGEGFEIVAYEPDFAVGAFERSRFRFQGGPLIGNDTVYQDIVPDRRIIFAYTMTLEDSIMSSSLVTVQFEPSDAGTRLVLTEQGAYLDGHDDVAGRERGMGELLDALGREVMR